MAGHLNLKFYRGTDTYSDGDVEEQIYNELKKSPGVMDILMRHNEWPFLYHLSPIRENILEWYDFNPDGTALEIGSGCGAITGLLCRKLKHVTCIDLSKRRSEINELKNRKYDNFEILVGNFEDITLEEKFDYVTLIGVLEYSIYYLHGSDPFGEMIRRAKDYLKPGGKLIVAIENKYGLKYWAGAREDHTGHMFDGIENYENVERVRTFSRHKLEQLIKDNGFESTDFYYPVPDYKMPSEIYSDDHLPGPGSIRNSSAAYDRSRYLLFSEDKACDGICEEGMFPEFANSFLVICR